MRVLWKFLVAASFGLFAMTVGASPANPVEGVDYRTLESPQQTASGAKVEVTEFFWYSCSHCNAFEAPLTDWVKKQGGAIVFKRVPVQFGQSPEQQQRFVPQQKLYYALEAMGKVDTLHQKVFDAIHVNRQTLNSDAAIADFMEKQGVDKKSFLDVYHSFGVQSKARRAAQLQQAYEIDGVPTVAIGGRYITAPSMMGASLGRQPEAVLASSALQVMNWLVEKAAREQSAYAATSMPAVAKK
jgi:protein dithiol oxidoreductase (disulfide-forming)